MTSQDLQQLIAQYLQDNDEQKIAELSELAKSSSQTAQQLVQIIENDPDTVVQAGAIRALGAANPDLLAAPLQKMLDSNADYSDYSTRATAAYLAGVYQVTALKNSLENLLRGDSSADVRYWCAVGLGELGDPSSLPVLEGAKNDNGWADNQQTVASAATNSILMIDGRFNL